MRCKYSEKDIKRWAKKYVATKKATLFSLEDEIGVSHSTIWWNFQHKLEDIDIDLFETVIGKFAVNKHKGGRKCQAVK